MLNAARVLGPVSAVMLAGVSLPCFAQLAEFHPIPGQSATPGTNNSFCGLSGTTGYSGVRVSEDGRVVGTVVYSPGNFSGGYVPTKAARWTQATGTQVISPVLQGLYPVTGLSADGSIVFGESWRWTAAAGYEDLTSRLGNGLFRTRTIFGCSSDGLTVTGIEGTYPAVGDFFRWRIDQSPVEILQRDAAFPHGYFYFNTISGDGSVVAGSTRTFDNGNILQDTYAPVVVGPAGPSVVAGESSQAGITDLSRDGSVAVGYLTDGPKLRAFRWTSQTGVVFLDAPLNDSNSSSYARAVNANGSVVVGDYLDVGTAGTRAWIWRDDSGFIDLYAELAIHGLSSAIEGWQLLVATDVSADGQTIVGQGINPSGCEQAFLVRLPGSVCAADYDQSGGLTVDDIFAFVNGWLAGDPHADFDNQSGLSVDDIFAYLNLWFAGC
jgi:uncharacterized membrane protein